MNKTKLARLAIKHYLETGKKLKLNSKKRGACFVSVYVKGELRGCIGNIESVGPLYKGIIENAIAAASRDFRFKPVTKEELKDLTTEVSILTPLKPYQPENNQDLLNFLSDRKPGLVLEKSGRRAVFLPQVWEKIATAEEFLRHLCFKAGLSREDWRSGMRFWTFTVN